MFEDAPALLLTLQIETIRKYSGLKNPMQLGTDIFCTILRELPCGVTEEFSYPGIFGLEFTTPEVRANWQKRIAAAGSQQPSFSSIPAAFRPFAESGCNVDEGGRGHAFIDFGEVLQKGLKSIYAQVADGNSPFEENARKTLLAVKEFAEKSGCKFPWEPAHDLDEAFQSIWLTYECIIFSELVPYSYSWGRMDQYLLPFAAEADEEELTEKFVHFFRFLEQVNFTDDASALNVGGPEGFNRVSRAIIEAVARNKSTTPMLAVRIPDHLPPEEWKRFLRPELISCGQPTLYGESSCRKALRFRGIPEEDISRWAVHSCMGLAICAEEWQDMWGAVLPLTLALEMVLNGGQFFNGKAALPPGTVPAEITSYPLLYQQLQKAIAFLFDAAVKAEKTRCAEFASNFQNVFVSLFYKDCIPRKKEIRCGGVRFHSMIVETMGIVNLADSLFTIQKLVFEQKKYTLRELTDALKNNFSDASDLLNDIANLPKFGQNSGEPEAIMQQLTADVAAIAEQFSGDGFFCIPSLHTLHQHITYGYRLNATADGRLAQEPLAKNAGVRPEIHTDHTSLILAVSSWEQARFSGGQPLDLWIAVHELQKQENLERYAVLLQTYLARGGLQLQLNGVDPEDLRAAREHPEKYGHLIVRIGGFSMRFVELGSNAQNDFIRRFSSGM